MRLPWLQIDADGLTRARMLGRLLGSTEAHGIGIAMTLWNYALEVSPDDDFTGNVPDAESIAAAVGWPIEDAPRLVRELQRVGFVATEPGLRVRGLDRYRAALESIETKRARWRRANEKRRKGADSDSDHAVTARLPRPTTAKTAARDVDVDVEKITTLSSELDDGSPFTNVFTHWQRVMNRPEAKPIDKRRRSVNARIREGYTVEQLQRAIDGCARTPHNMGQNEQHKRFDDLELICRNGAQVERFIRNASGAVPALQAVVRVLTDADRKNLYADPQERAHEPG